MAVGSSAQSEAVDWLQSICQHGVREAVVPDLRGCCQSRVGM
jgi:hypothetical protein